MVARITRLAALCHDLGHGPLSHTFDSFALTPSDLGPRIAEAASLRSIRAAFPSILGHTESVRGADGSSIKRVSHESMSCLFAAEILFDLSASGVIPTKDATLLARAITVVLIPKSAGAAPNWISVRLAPWLGVARDIVSGAPVDADRMDYLERDSRACGVSYGLFDRNRVLKSLLICRTKGNVRPVLRIGIKKSGIPAIENFVQARFELFRQVYHHKTNAAISSMLEELAANRPADPPVIAARTWPDLRRFYENLSDESFIDGLRNDKHRPTRKIAEQLFLRRLWKRVADLPSQTSADRMIRKLVRRFPRQGLLVRSSIPTKPTKGLDKQGGVILERDPDGAYCVHRASRWTDIRVSAIINALHSDSLVLHRLFYAEHDPKHLKSLKQAVASFTGRV